MRVSGVWICALAAGALMAPSRAAAQEAGPATTQASQPAAKQEPPPPPTTREGAIEQKQAEKAQESHPYESNAGERWAKKAQDILEGGGLHWHPFFENAYSGGGFTLGLGYKTFVSPYNTID